MKHSLAIQGLSMTQAQSISNLINQRAVDIEQELSLINNSRKTVNLDGEVFVMQEAFKMPTNIIDLLKEKAQLYACQGFLMENIKAKDKLLITLRKMEFDYKLEAPEYPKFKYFDLLSSVNEEWAWQELSTSQYNEFLEQEALAAHIGQFIHKNGKLDTLRKEITAVKPLEWITLNQGTVNSNQRPVKVVAHHTQSELLGVHTELAALHRQYEQRVNYFKSMTKNMVTEENARIARLNADGQSAAQVANQALQLSHEGQMKAYNAARDIASNVFEAERQKETSVLAAMRIQVDNRFQPVVDGYLKMLEVK